MRKPALFLAAAMALSLLCTPALAAGGVADAVRFSAMDNTVIRMYFTARPVVWSGLPPRVARDFGRGKTLPANVVTYALPRELLAKLPPRAGFEYARVGADVALIDRTSLIVVDLIENVFG